MIQKRFFSLLAFFFLSIFSFSIANAMDEDLEGILKKNLKKYKIDNAAYGKYLVDSESFSKIFSPCIISKDKKNPPIWSVAQVLDENQIDAIGTAVAIKEETNKNILFMTAKHVVEDGKVTFRFGSQVEGNSDLGLPDSQYTDLICHEVKCFVHPSLDFAIVEAEIKQNKTNINFPISKYTKNHIFDYKVNYDVYHYPWGIEGQRLSSGKIAKDLTYESKPCFAHYIDTLPGSSGAPIFYKDEVIGIHIGRGKLFSRTKIGIDYQDKEDLDTIFHDENKFNNAVYFNRYIPLSKVEFKELQELIR